RRGSPRHQFLDIYRDDDRSKLLQFPNPAPVAPLEKLPESLSIGGSGIFVSDVGREELHETPRGLRAFAFDQKRKARKTGAGELAMWNWNDGERQLAKEK